MKQKEKRKLPLSSLTVLLLAAVLMTTGVTFSQYVTTATGEDTARVAAFAVSSAGASGQSSSLSIDCADSDTLTQTYQFTVSNTEYEELAEVAIEYDVVVTLSEALPAGVTVGLDNETVGASDDGKTYTFEDAGSFDVGRELTNMHSLTFTADPNTAEATDTPISITVSIYAAQID